VVHPQVDRVWVHSRRGVDVYGLLLSADCGLVPVSSGVGGVSSSDKIGV